MLLSDIRRYLKHGTLPQLRAFEASARLGSVTRAARELHMAQATASVQIKKLSETIGLPLFEQVGRRIYLTDAGRRVYSSCDEVFRAFSTLEGTLTDLRSLASGELHLAASTAARYLAPRLLGAFVQEHPGVEVALHIDNHGGLIERLDRNADDLYLFVEAPARREVVAQALLSNPLVVFARHDHPLTAERRIPLGRLAREPFLIREPGSGTRATVLRLFAHRGLAPRIQMELSSDEAIREAIADGLGVSILPRHTLALEPENEELACLDAEGFPLPSQWHLVYPVGKRLSAAARAFLDLARLRAKRLAGQGEAAAAG